MYLVHKTILHGSENLCISQRTNLLAPISNKLNWVLLLYRIVSFYGLKQNPNVLLQFAGIQVKQAQWTIWGTWGFVPTLFFASGLTAIPMSEIQYERRKTKAVTIF